MVIYAAMSGFDAGEYQIEWHDLAPRITTKRLVLRLPTKKDVDELLDFYERNSEHFEPWMSASALRPTKKMLLESIKERHELAQEDRGYRFNLFLRSDTARVIGLCSISDIRRRAIQQCVLGYAMDKDMQGQGLMKEAVGASIRFAFGDLDLHRIEGSYQPNNVVSAAILSSFGFEQQGYFKEYLLLNNAWQDHVVTFLVNREWKGCGRKVK